MLMDWDFIEIYNLRSLLSVTGEKSKGTLSILEFEHTQLGEANINTMVPV